MFHRVLNTLLSYLEDIIKNSPLLDSSNQHLPTIQAVVMECTEYFSVSFVFPIL